VTIWIGGNITVTSGNSDRCLTDIIMSCKHLRIK